MNQHFSLCTFHCVTIYEKHSPLYTIIHCVMNQHAVHFTECMNQHSGQDSAVHWCEVVLDNKLFLWQACIVIIVIIVIVVTVITVTIVIIVKLVSSSLSLSSLSSLSLLSSLSSLYRHHCHSSSLMSLSSFES